MSVLIESCNEYLYENLNIALYEHDTGNSLWYKIKDFFKRIWIYIKSIVYKIIGKTIDESKELEWRIRHSKEPSDIRLTKAIEFYKKAMDITELNEDIKSLKTLKNLKTIDNQEIKEKFKEIDNYRVEKDVRIHNLNDLKEINELLTESKKKTDKLLHDAESLITSTTNDYKDANKYAKDMELSRLSHARYIMEYVKNLIRVCENMTVTFRVIINNTLYD